MAVQYPKLVKDIKEYVLTKEELELVNKQEEEIDKIIDAKFKDIGDKIYIELCYAQFYWIIGSKTATGLPSHKRHLLQKELEKRYIMAGWSVKEEYDDGLDGPNMSGPDYWVLKGKE